MPRTQLLNRLCKDAEEKETIRPQLPKLEADKICRRKKGRRKQNKIYHSSSGLIWSNDTTCLGISIMRAIGTLVGPGLAVFFASQFEYRHEGFQPPEKHTASNRSSNAEDDSKSGCSRQAGGGARYW